MTCCWKIVLLGIICLVCFVSLPVTAQPTCSNTYTISVGINTTSGTTLDTIDCTANSGTVSYAIDGNVDGADYFAIDSASGDLTLANRLDVEYGPVTWNIIVIVTDGGGTFSQTVSVRTFISTTTTTSTQPPPGYAWFDNTSNVYLFWAVMGLTAVIFGSCILLCVQFHKKGRCLPKSCPEYGHMIASFNRQVNCCPIPCDYYAGKIIEEEEEPEEEEDDYVKNTPFGLPLRKPKSETPKKAATPVKAETPKKAEVNSGEKELETERSVVVTPLVIGNANLDDVGFDGMRSPGFNAPMFTSYGGKKGTASKVLKKY